MIFDTTDPVMVTKTIDDSIDELYRGESEPEQPVDVEMIELRDMGYNLRGSERALDAGRREYTREERELAMAHSQARRMHNERMAELARES